MSHSISDTPRSKADLLSRGVKQPTIGTSRRLPVLALLDTSGSVRGQAFADACAGVSTLASFLAQPENAGAFQLALAVFNHAARLVVPLCPATEFRMPAGLSAEGGTDFAEALSLAKSHVEPFAAGEGVASRPTVVFLTDGHHEAKSDPTPLAARMRELANVVAIGVGSGADTGFLSVLASAPHLVIGEASSATLTQLFSGIGQALSRSRRAGVSLAASGIDPFASRRR